MHVTHVTHVAHVHLDLEDVDPDHGEGVAAVGHCQQVVHHHGGEGDGDGGVEAAGDAGQGLDTEITRLGVDRDKPRS